MFYIFYFLTCGLVSLFFSLPKIRLDFVQLMAVTFLKAHCPPVFERGDGPPGGPEVDTGSIDGEKANLLKMK